MRCCGTEKIETERLRLRRFTQADAAAMYENWACDPCVTRWMRWEPHPDAACTAALLREWEAAYNRPDCYHWAIERAADGVLMGSIGVVPGERFGVNGRPEPGYCLGRAFWGRGYATEALCAVVAYMFRGTDISALECCHALENPASGRVMRKAGFAPVEEGEYHKFDGTPVRCRFYELTREQYEALRHAGDICARTGGVLPGEGEI